MQKSTQNSQLYALKVTLTSKTYNNRVTGFTLIELMIVVSIIGILASIALPSYQDYIAHSQVASAITLLGGAHDMVEEDVYQRGVFPADESDLLSLGVVVQGNYGIISTVAAAQQATGTLTYTFSSGNSQLQVTNENTLSFSRDASGIWSCTSTILAKLIPKVCSHS